MPDYELGPGPEQPQDEEADSYSQFIAAVPLMIKMARYAAMNEAISYRGVHVGASAYAIKFDGSKGPTVIGGANYKPDKSSPKYCAEMDVIDQLEEDGYDEILGMVVAGTMDQEIIKSIMGRPAPTLHPCQACREKMTKSGLITTDTIILTIGLESDRYQVHTIPDLRFIYETEEKEGVSMMSSAEERRLEYWPERQNVFDSLTRDDMNNDFARAARLVLSMSDVSLGET